MPTHDLLSEPVFKVTLPGAQRSRLTLAGVFANLARDDITSFDHLRPHQDHAWFAFLVQLAAIALHEAGAELDGDEATWRQLLLRLTEERGGPSAWCLVVEDLAVPAFMQPPVPEGDLAKFKHEALEPDDSGLDVLVTTRHHDVKFCRTIHPQVDHWVYALVTLQTIQGFSGRSNYGIARMNGGYGNRPCVTIAPGDEYGLRFRRDVRTLLESRGELLEAHVSYADSGGGALLWLYPWDGTASLSVESLDPYFIEVCRRVRLREESAQIRAVYAPTAVTRVKADHLKGDTGDPWTPVSSDGKAFTVGREGFSYRRVHSLLFSRNFEPGLTQQLRPGDPDQLAFVCRALARGQGKTEGLHGREIPIPGGVRRRLLDATERDRLGALAEDRVVAVKTFQSKVLRPALCALFQGGVPRLKLDDERAGPWMRQHDAGVDGLFFPSLWRVLDLGPAEQQAAWHREVLELGRRVLLRAEESAPIPAVRRYAAFAAAEGLFWGSAHKLWTDAFQKEEVPDEQRA